MGHIMKENGLEVSKTAKGFKFGLMDLFMRATGNKIKPMDVGDSSMLMAMFTTEIGRMIKHMVMEDIITLMELNMKEIGSKINSMATVRKFGQIMPSMKVSTMTERNTDKVSLTGQMGQPILAILLTTISMVMVYIPGLMAVNIQVNGISTKCTAQEYSRGPTVESTKENILTTKKKVMEFSSGLMAVNTMVCGRMESSMAREPTFLVNMN